MGRPGIKKWREKKSYRFEKTFILNMDINDNIIFPFSFLLVGTREIFQ